jgi:phosphopantetheinyl transferase
MKQRQETTEHTKFTEKRKRDSKVVMFLAIDGHIEKDQFLLCISRSPAGRPSAKRQAEADISFNEDQ